MPRATSAALDALLDQEIQVLDHGFVMPIDYIGNDESIVQAARLSYQKGTRTSRDDESLIRYLMRHQHTSPTEMASLKLHVKCPIFVARQWGRHRTAKMNEYSGRYSVMDEDFYLPDDAQIQPQSSANKQGRDGEFSDDKITDILDNIEALSSEAYQTYTDLVEGGLARELARTVLPVNFYTQFIWKIDLHNLLHFLRLRLDSHAQHEIRVYAEEIADIVAQWVPMTWRAFEDYVLDAYTISGPEIHALATGDTDGMSSREIEAFNALKVRISDVW